MKLNILFYLLVLFYFITVSGELKCGRPQGSNILMQNERIVSGYDVGYYRYPWYAALIQKKQVSCGGALIGPKLVITAAHCYKEYLELANKSSVSKLENIYTVRLGMYNICTTEETVKEFSIEKVQVHELYATKKPYFDICLLTLASSTEKFEPLCLPSGKITTRPKEGTVPGMGVLKYQGAMPCTLHEARLLIYPDTTCHKMVNDTGNSPDEIKNAFCAGYLSGGIDTCQGDSGGPFQIVDEDGKYILLGIVSFGFHCAMPNFLGMYTDVSQYIDWIKETVGSDGIEAIVSPHKNKSESSSDDNDTMSLSSSSSDEDENSNNSYHKHTHFAHQHNHHHHHHHYPHRNPIRIIILNRRKHNNRKEHYHHRKTRKFND